MNTYTFIHGPLWQHSGVGIISNSSELCLFFKVYFSVLIKLFVKFQRPFGVNVFNHLQDGK